MADIKIAVINRSTVVRDDEAKAAVAALQIQVSRDYRPVWGCDADLTFVSSGENPPQGMWWLTILDNSDTAGALGYHDVTDENLPMGKVFAKTDLQYGAIWTVTASHELLEMLGDPDINLTVFAQQTATTGRLFAYENCDAVEADQYGYKIDDILVSDFVFPSWFEQFHTTPETRYDFQGYVKNAFELLPGGYIGVFDVTAGTGWQQVMPQEATPKYSMRAHVGSRRERRRTPRDSWLRSRTK